MWRSKHVCCHPSVQLWWVRLFQTTTTVTLQLVCWYKKEWYCHACTDGENFLRWWTSQLNQNWVIISDHHPVQSKFNPVHFSWHHRVVRCRRIGVINHRWMSINLYRLNEGNRSSNQQPTSMISSCYHVNSHSKLPAITGLLCYERTTLNLRVLCRTP